MFNKKQHRRSSNPVFVIFRLILSLTMFGVLLAGSYSAYKHFSGLDPLKLDPQALLSNLIQSKTPKEFFAVLTALKIDPKILGIGKKDNVIPQDNLTEKSSNQKTSVPAVFTERFSFMLIADSHNDNSNLAKALAQAKSAYPNLSFIIGLGDYTDVGTVAELKAAKKELDSSGLRYFVLAGDHDLWDSRDKQSLPFSDEKGKQTEGALTNFYKIFGPSYQSFVFNGYKFLLLDNSDNYKGFGDEQTKWANDELAKKDLPILVFLHEPLYHPSSDHYMGRVEASLKQQAQAMIYQLKQSDVKKIFAGDIHYFSEYEEPVTKVSMGTVGAIVTERNPQTPRYAIVTVYEDGKLSVDDVSIK